MSRYAILFFILTNLSCWASELPLEKYAYGKRINVQGSSALVELVLTEDVYQRIIHRDLSDMRVFNNDGVVVPHALVLQQAFKEQRNESAELAFFPLYEQEMEKGDNVSVRIRTDKQGAIIDVDNSGQVKSNSRVDSYVLDVSHVKKPIHKLIPHLKGTSDNFIATVAVQASDDLSSWRTILQATIAKLNYSGHEINKSEFNLAGFSGKYLRLRWPEKLDSMVLESIQATLVEHSIKEELSWTQTQATIDEKYDGDYFVDTHAVHSIAKVHVGFPERNTFVQASLSSRSESSHPWRDRFHGFLYHLESDGVQLINDEIQLPNISDRYWRLSIEQTGGGLGKGLPGIKFGWNPHKLIFVARGNPPYVLAYGNVNAGGQSQKLDPLLSNLKNNTSLIQKATFGENVMYAGETALTPLKDPFPWKKWLLWAVLVLGVGIVSWMALHLSKQMKES